MLRSHCRWPSRRTLAALFASAVALLAGCSTPPSRDDPATRIGLPAGYRNAPPGPAGSAAPTRGETSATATPPAAPARSSAQVLRPWWQTFGNRELDRLADRALANNRDLRIATLQIAQAGRRAEQVGADGKPRIAAPLQAAMQAPGGQVGAVPVSPRSSSRPQSSFQASVQALWQPDLWGEREGMAESADLQVRRALYEWENVQRNLLGSLVAAYVDYLLANDAIRLARDSEATARGIVALLEQRLAAGDATADELEQKRAALYSLQLGMPGLELQREQARNGLALLVGSVPAELELSSDGLDALAAPELPGALPPALLFQRADIRAIEARMKSAHADIDVARARMLPALNLSGQLGYSGTGVLQLLQPQNLFWNLISGMTVSIFDGGRKEADKALSQAAYEEMVETYARTVLQAVREVEGALAGVRAAGEQFALQRRVTGSGLQTYRLSEAGHAVGAVDSTSLLEARKGHQRYLEEERRRKAELLKSHVTLIQALGGSAGGPLVADPRDDAIVAALGPADDAELFAGAAGAPPAAGWQVALAGVHHQATIAAVWRDLQSRYPQQMQDRGLRVRQNGRIDSAGEAPQAWHQLSVTRFAGKDSAERFCNLLRERQQQCAVEAADTAPAGIAWPGIVLGADSGRRR